MDEILNLLPDFSGILLAAVGVALVIYPEAIKSIEHRRGLRWTIALLLVALGGLGMVSSFVQKRDGDRAQNELKEDVLKLQRTINTFGPKLDDILAEPNKEKQKQDAGTLKEEIAKAASEAADKPTSVIPAPVQAPTPPDPRLELVRQARDLSGKINNLADDMRAKRDALNEEHRRYVEQRTRGIEEGPEKEGLKQHINEVFRPRENAILDAAAQNYQSCCQQEAIRIRNALVLEAPGVADQTAFTYVYSRVFQAGQPSIQDWNVVEYRMIADDLEKLANACEKNIKQ